MNPILVKDVYPVIKHCSHFGNSPEKCAPIVKVSNRVAHFITVCVSVKHIGNNTDLHSHMEFLVPSVTGITM